MMHAMSAGTDAGNLVAFHVTDIIQHWTMYTREQSEHT